MSGAAPPSSPEPLALLEELGRLLLGADPMEALQEAAARLAEALSFARCSVLAWPGDQPTTIYVAASSDDPAVARLPLDLARYPEVVQALSTREPVFVEEASSSELLGAYAPLAARHGGRSLLVVPMVADRPIGVLLLRSHVRHSPLDEQGRRLVLAAANIFCLAIRGGRIFESFREQTRRFWRSPQDIARQRAVEQYRDFFESSADGMAVVTGDGDLLYFNRSAEQLTGYARAWIQGRKLSEIVDELDRASLDYVIQQAAEGVHLAGFDLCLATTSGEPLLVSVSTSGAFAEQGAVVLSFRDVTVARRLEQELRQTKDFLERLIDSTVDGIIAADIEGNILIFNKGAEQIYGYTADQVVGRLPVAGLYPDGEAAAILAELRSPTNQAPGRMPPSRRHILTQDGEVVPVLLSAAILYEEGREIATVGVLSDLREKLRIEQRLAQAQEKLVASERQAVIAELAGTTAHELNQPLTSVMGYAELLMKRLPEGDSNRRAIETILREAERMAEIVRKIGRITRYEIKAYVGATTIIDLDKSTSEE